MRKLFKKKSFIFMILGAILGALTGIVEQLVVHDDVKREIANMQEKGKKYVVVEEVKGDGPAIAES